MANERGYGVSLGSLPAALLIPPLNLLPLGLAGVALSALHRPGWRRLGRWATGIAMVGLFGFSLPVVGGTLIWSLEAGLPRDPVAAAAARPPGAIVVLSADAGFGTVGGIEPGSGIGAMTLDRMRAGVILARRTGLPLLVTGGRLERGARSIARQMAASLHDDFGLAARWVEPLAADTWQNARFSARLLRADGIGAVYVVSDAWHLKRALIAFARTGVTAIPAAVRFDRPPDFQLDDFVPHVSALQSSYYALHEWIGCAYYALRG